jgi:C-type mannose receptor
MKAFDPPRNETKTWYEAIQFCMNKGGNLASFQTRNGFNKVYNEQKVNLKPDKTFWIGLNRLDNKKSWQWTDGSPANFFNWVYLQPDDHNGIEDCVHTAQYGQWSDSICDTNRGWICRIEKNVDPDQVDVIIPEDALDGKLSKN